MNVGADLSTTRPELESQVGRVGPSRDRPTEDHWSDVEPTRAPGDGLEEVDTSGRHDASGIDKDGVEFKENL